MDRDQLAEHLRFAAELGVSGVSRDPAWRKKGDGSHFRVPDSNAKPLGTKDRGGQVSLEKATIEVSTEMTPVPFFASPAEALAWVKTDIGECTRCKLHGLG